MILGDAGDCEVIDPAKRPQIESLLDMLARRVPGTLVGRVVPTSGHHDTSVQAHFVAEAADLDRSIAPRCAVKTECCSRADLQLVLEQVDSAEGRNPERVLSHFRPGTRVESAESGSITGTEQGADEVLQDAIRRTILRAPKSSSAW